MWVVLDTNHFTELVRESAAGLLLQERLIASNADVFLPVVAAQECLQGWLAVINRHKAGPDQVSAYLQFRRSLEALARFSVLDFDAKAASRFLEIQKQCPRVGAMDLKIAAICLEHDAMVLTRNLGDFECVPGLRVENWLD
jgi:tRNA(fMet)-specific endonuclease VapC